MNKKLVVVLFVVAGVVWSEVLSCTSCGSECQSACGTRHFRTCCFNYLKKRNSPSDLPLAINPSLRLELWLARSRSAYYQQGVAADNNNLFDSTGVSSVEMVNKRDRTQDLTP